MRMSKYLRQYLHAVFPEMVQFVMAGDESEQ